MTFFNNFTNFDMNYLMHGLNNCMIPSIDAFNQCPNDNFNRFTSNTMPFFNFDQTPMFNMTNCNLSDLFDWNSPIWNNTSQYINNNGFTNYSWNNYNLTVGDSFTSKRKTNSLQLSLVDKAKSYAGRVNSDAEGNRLFSGGASRQWCADFVSYNVREIFGSKLPSSFQHFASVSALRSWGKNNGCYKQIPNTGKANFIASSVKPGDIMIEKNGGKSHTGIVTKVNSDGSFETVEGNCGNSVKSQTYTADSPTLSGFISLEKYSMA